MPSSKHVQRDEPESVALMHVPNVSNTSPTACVDVHSPDCNHLSLSCNDFIVQFRSLNYRLKPNWVDSLLNCIKRKTSGSGRLVLSQISGQLCSGQMTAVVGPSGSGKSTLLECLVAARSYGEFSGQIRMVGNTPIDWALIPQADAFNVHLTARQSLWFAYHLKNRHCSRLTSINRSATDGAHSQASIEMLLQQMGLDTCADTLVANLSGGERKRLSIAQELTSNPRVLLLDEPTSSLDAASSLQLMQLLRKLATNQLNCGSRTGGQITILATIHQPSDRVLQQFDRIMALSRQGQLIYSGSMVSLVKRLERFHLQINANDSQVKVSNGDLLLEIASGIHGENTLQHLSSLQTNTDPTLEWPHHDLYQTSDWYTNLSQLTDQINRSMVANDNQSYKIRRQRPPIGYYGVFAAYLMTFSLLLYRHLLHLYRNKYQFAIKFGVYIFFILVISELMDGWSASGGCVTQFSINRTLILPDLVQFQQKLSKEKEALTFNLSAYFLTLNAIQLVIVLGSSMVWPLHEPIFKKEYLNKWYQLSADYLSLNLFEFSLHWIVFTVASTVFYVYTDQPDHAQRYFLIMLVVTVLILCTEGHGMLIGIISSSNMILGSMIASCTIMLLICFTGFFMMLKHMSSVIKPLYYISYSRYSFEAAITSIYGLDRCGQITGRELMGSMQKMLQQLTESFVCGLKQLPPYSTDDQAAKSMAFNLTTSVTNAIGPLEIKTDEKLTSLVMKSFDLDDDDIWIGIVCLVGYGLFFHLTSYLIVRFRGRTLN